MSDNLSELSGRKGLKDNLFDRMGQLAMETGTPSIDELEKLAKEFLVGDANTYGTATFYDFMKPENKGKKAYVCNGTACLCAGTQHKVQETLEGKFQAEEIGHMTCLGRCHENNAFHINGVNYSGNSIEAIDQIIQKNQEEKDSYQVQSIGTKVLTEDFPGLDEHYKILETALTKSRDEILDEVKTSNIRGRGGAGFPMGVKWEFCKNEKSDVKFIICNADEGDPGAYSDRYIMEEKPHSLLLGMIVAGYAIGSSYGVLYIRAEYPDSVRIINNAIEELRANNLIGENILGSEFSFDFKVIQAQGAYICGEETALINSIEGQRPEVRVRPPFPAQKGLFNKPTIVNNVETLAAVPWILREGGEKYASLGTGKSTGTKLVCLDSFFNKPGICEVEMGTPLDVVINELGGGFKNPVKAMQIGGPLGGLVPIHKTPELSVDFESFHQAGFLLGHASIVCIPEDFRIIDFLEHLFDFAAFESCGKCFPCRLGTKRAQEMFDQAREGSYKIDRELLNDLLNTLEAGSLCAHGGGIPLPAKNALQYFEEELKQYFAN